jgi:hypothetical protein
VAFAWTYLVCVSVVTDLRDRYVVILVSFVALQCAVEVYALASRALPRRGVATVVSVLLVVGGFAGMPRNFSSVQFDSNYGEWVAPYAELRRHVAAGDAVFAAAPLDALLLGASYRALPNSGLEQLVRYAHKTGVRWVVVVDLPHNLLQVEGYEESWYLLPGRRRDAFVSDWLEKRADIGRGRYALYRIRGIWPGRRTPDPSEAD